MKTLLAAICACLALGLVVAGCGGDDDSSSDSGAAATTEQPADTGSGGATTDKSSGGAEAKSGAKVVMKDIAFQPSNITVSKGDSVTWTNDDSVGHDVTKESGPGADFASGDPGGIQGGQTFTEKFKTPGTYKYVCSVHPGMEGTVTVK